MYIRVRYYLQRSSICSFLPAELKIENSNTFLLGRQWPLHQFGCRFFMRRSREVWVLEYILTPGHTECDFIICSACWWGFPAAVDRLLCNLNRLPRLFSTARSNAGTFESTSFWLARSWTPNVCAVLKLFLLFSCDALDRSYNISKRHVWKLSHITSRYWKAVTICISLTGIRTSRAASNCHGQNLGIGSSSEPKPLYEYQAAFAFQFFFVFFLSVDCGWMLGRTMSDVLLERETQCRQSCMAVHSVTFCGWILGMFFLL